MGDLQFKLADVMGGGGGGGGGLKMGWIEDANVYFYHLYHFEIQENLR